MRAKRLVGAVAVGALVCGGATVAGAYTINDDPWDPNTQVWAGNSRSDDVETRWSYDYLGGTDTSNTNDTKKIEITWAASIVTFNLYTNAPYDESSTWNNTTYRMYLADLALDPDLDGVFEYGVVLYDHNNWLETSPAGSENRGPGLYSVTDWYTSYDFFEETHNGDGAAYGEWYGPENDKKNPIVAIKDDSFRRPLLDTLDLSDRVNQTVLAGDPHYMYSFSFDTNGLSGFTPDQMHIFWGTRTCANDVIENPVPEPATMLLFGTGLVGLASLRRRMSRGNIIKKEGVSVKSLKKL